MFYNKYNYIYTLKYKYIMKSKKELEMLQLLIKILSEATQEKTVINIDDDRISKLAAAKMIGVTFPTLDKLIIRKQFIQHNIGHKCFFLKSEILNGLRNYHIKPTRDKSKKVIKPMP